MVMDIKSIREIIGILMESNNYFRLTLKERKELINYIIKGHILILSI
ncbi:MAG TPA: hypothetical protein PLW88_01235 [Syntrophorhabdaceae bacterium]|nr:hypothetical protein [Syntrophorhabdaceae bacterium]HPP05963.1 hypothetical protein [Syntrophorhabdaceae bacterium]